MLYNTTEKCDGKGGLQVKIVFASTPSQQEEINGLVRYIYENVFPLYFTDEEIDEYERLKVLQTSDRNFEDYSTLKDAFYVMTSLQTLISILESASLDESYSTLFKKNAANLQEFGLFFPFEFEQFTVAKSLKTGLFSVYTKAANELLV
jgi:hypothetical protein